MKCRKENFFWRGRDVDLLRASLQTGPKKKRKPRHKMRKLKATGGVEAAEKKLVTYFEKIMC